MAEPDTILAWLRAREDDMVALLEQLALAETPSDVPETQHAALDVLASELHAAGLATRRVRGRRYGDQLFARPGDRLRRVPYQLLVGHVDTVWPLGTTRTMRVVLEDGTVHGPGVFDMKGGLVQLVYALHALHALGRAPEVTPVVLVNADEEVGSVESRVWIERLARGAARAFVLEPAFGPAGSLKTARKSVGHFTVRVRGRAAHAGVDPEAGVSAILELTHQVQRLFALNDPTRGITVNVGTIDGGLRPNVIAPEAVAEVDARVPTVEAAREVEQAIRSLVPVGEGTALEVEGRFGRLPLEPTPRNRALWRLARDAGARLGLALDEAAVGGASDGNITSVHTATLDGLGAVGDGAHAPHEHVLASHMPERAALLALLLLAPVEAS
jgi:glutamate carboxypeptidase